MKRRSKNVEKADPFDIKLPPNPMPNPAEEPIPDLMSFDQATYGAIPDLPASGRVIARPIDINRIAPDLRQPRRTIPVSVRGDWDGSPTYIPQLLATWHQLAEDRLGAEIDLAKLLRSPADRDESKKYDDPIVDSFFDVIALAISIDRDGLVNPIRVVQRSVTDYMIESGERRWLAHHMLALHIDDKYRKVPAIEKKAIDVWAQAAENGARAPLNAIGMARQLALLIIDMYKDDDGISFARYEDMILPGECDRKYYAQVANGNIFRIKKGMQERILAVTGLKSKFQINHYRSLLSIPDAIWQKADEQNWAEFAIRDYMQSHRQAEENTDRLTIVNLSEDATGESDADMWTTVHVSDDDTMQNDDIPEVTNPNLGRIKSMARPAGASEINFNDLVIADDEIVYKVTLLTQHAVNVIGVDGRARAFNPETLTPIRFFDNQPNPPLNKIQMAMVKQFTAMELDDWNNQPTPPRPLDKPLSANLPPPRQPAAPPQQTSLPTGLSQPERDLLSRAYNGWIGGEYEDGWFVVMPGSPDDRTMLRLTRSELVVSEVYEDVLQYRISIDGCKAIGKPYPKQSAPSLYSASATAVTESTSAILDTFDNAQPVISLLRLLKRFTNDNASEIALQELLTISRADIARYAINKLSWSDYLNKAAGHTETELKNLVSFLSDYVAHLDQVGQEIANRLDE